MSFYNSYPNRKDWREPYRSIQGHYNHVRDGRAYDSSCCAHHGCSYCANKRTFNDRKHRTIADEELRDFLNRDIRYGEDFEPIFQEMRYGMKFFTTLIPILEELDLEGK
jgi:hypothetical protein